MAAVTPSGRVGASAVVSSDKRVRDTVGSILNASIVLAGLGAVEALFDILNRNVLGALVSLLLMFIPACGWYGALCKNPKMLRVFYVANALCALCYLAGVGMLAGVVIPSMRCACDPACGALGAGNPAAGGVQLVADPLGEGELLQFHGADVDDRAETPAVAQDVFLQNEYDDMCSRVGFLQLYASAALSLAAAAIYAYSFFLGRRLRKFVSSGVAGATAGGKAGATRSVVANSGPLSAPGALSGASSANSRAVVPSIVTPRPELASGRSGLFQRPSPVVDVEAQASRRGLLGATAFSGDSGPRSSNSVGAVC